jgi:hypothetical protein
MALDAEFLRSNSTPRFACFCGPSRIAEGSLAEVALAAWRLEQSKAVQPILTFNRETGAVVDLNLSGTENDVANRYIAVGEASPKRGRPKLGVIPREITLLPRHWEWLARQQGGASATLRRLIDAARKDRSVQDAARERVAAAYSFIAAIAGDLPLFEEASRELFSHNFDRFETLIANWSPDIQNELRLFLRDLWPQPSS